MEKSGGGVGGALAFECAGPNLEPRPVVCDLPPGKWSEEADRVDCGSISRITAALPLEAAGECEQQWAGADDGEKTAEQRAMIVRRIYERR